MYICTCVLHHSDSRAQIIHVKAERDRHPKARVLPSGLPGDEIKTKSASTARSSQIPQGFIGAELSRMPAASKKDTGE